MDQQQEQERQKLLEQQFAENLPPGEFEEPSAEDTLSRFLTQQLLGIELKEKPKALTKKELLSHMFSREDILGNIQSWEKTKLMGLHQLQKACQDLGLDDAGGFFLKEEKKLLTFSRSVNGFQQKILRTSLGGKIEDEKKSLLGFKWGWK